MIQMTLYRYPTVPTTDKTFKAGAGFVLDGYFYGTQGLLASSKPNYQEFNALRAVIPTPTVSYEGTTATTNEYVVNNGVVAGLYDLKKDPNKRLQLAKLFMDTYGGQ